MVREVSILLPLVLLLLVLVSTVTLLAYRGAIDELGRAPDETGGALARELDRQQALVQRLTWVVVPVNVALVLFMLVYLRHLVTPFEALLDRAKGVAAIEESASTDEVDFLVSTFERAIAALAKGGQEEPDEREIAALQRALGSSLDSGVLLMDDSRRVLAVNPVGGELLLLPPPADDRPQIGEYCRDYPELVALLEDESTEGEGVSRRELELLKPDGTPLTLGLTTHRLRRDDGTIRGRLALFVDLTEARRRSDEQQRASSLAQLGRMSAGLAHELRNSLAALRGYLTLIERHSDGDSIEDYLGEIRSESDRLQRVVEDFLSFARPEAKLETFPLVDLAAHLAGDPALDGPPVEVRNELETGLRIRADRQLLERALRNLLRNGSQANRESESAEPLELALTRTADHLTIQVADRGPGLPAGDVERLFEPFATSRPDGIGLGLPLAQRILELHGGTLNLRGREGGGTVAVAALPLGIIVT